MADYIVGGLAFDYGGLLLPFQIAFCLLVFTTIFGTLFLPYIAPIPPSALPDESEEMMNEKKSRSFLYPLKIFVPRTPMLGNNPKGPGRDWNLTFLGLGAFVSVLATGYVGMGLQLVATNVFGFKPGPSGLMLVSLFVPIGLVSTSSLSPKPVTEQSSDMMGSRGRWESAAIGTRLITQSLNLAMRAFFLTILFPRIITHGRQYLSHRSSAGVTPFNPSETALPSGLATSSTTEPTDLPSPIPETLSSPTRPVDVAHGSTFDLYFLQSSILLDGILTALTSFADKGWEMYLAAAVLPFASGTGSAVKGVAMDLVKEEEKEDALSGIALIEKLGKYSRFLSYPSSSDLCLFPGCCDLLAICALLRVPLFRLLLPVSSQQVDYRLMPPSFSPWRFLRPFDVLVSVRHVRKTDETIAQVSTISLFGFVFSAFSEMGIPTAVFLANGVCPPSFYPHHLTLRSQYPSSRST